MISNIRKIYIVILFSIMACILLTFKILNAIYGVNIVYYDKGEMYLQENQALKWNFTSLLISNSDMKWIKNASESQFASTFVVKLKDESHSTQSNKPSKSNISKSKTYHNTMLDNKLSDLQLSQNEGQVKELVPYLKSPHNEMLLTKTESSFQSPQRGKISKMVVTNLKLVESSKHQNSNLSQIKASKLEANLFLSEEEAKCNKSASNFQCLHKKSEMDRNASGLDRDSEFDKNESITLGIKQQNPLQDSRQVTMEKKEHKLRFPFSRDMIVHSAYFDRRPRHNHTNVTVMFVSINKTIIDRGWVIGCGVDDKNASAFLLYSLFENELMHTWLGEKPFKYESMAIYCYDVDAKNGSEAFVIYKTSSSSREITVISQSPLFFPAPRKTSLGKYNFSALICTKVHNRGVKFLKEFVLYQKTLGVDHIHVSILDDFVRDNGFQDMVIRDPFMLKQYVEGFLTFSVWKEWYAKGKWNKGNVYLHSEILRKLDCVYRYLETYDYVMLVDTDDFFVPRIPGKANLKDYILQYCYSKTTGSCRFQWVWHYPHCGIRGKIVDGNVTKHLKSKIYNPNEAYNFKSVHSTKAIFDASFHDARCPECLRPGYGLVDVPTSIAYVAHLRYEKVKRTYICERKGPLL